MHVLIIEDDAKTADFVAGAFRQSGFIEDDAKTADFVAGAFRQSGYVCTICADGLEGSAAALANDYDAAVVDIMLPGKDGLSIIRSLRAAGKDLPVIVLSARGEVDARIKGLEAGADDYLAKPFSVAELLARVQALMRRASRQAESTVLKVESRRCLRSRTSRWTSSRTR